MVGDGISCWGANGWGQLGNGTKTGSSLPVVVRDISSRATSVSLGSFNSCAALADRTVYCWGNNSDGQLGNGTKIGSPLPVAVSNLSRVISISLGSFSACAVRDDGVVSCWGFNMYGFGDGITTQSTTPVKIKLD